ncbi:MAG: S4 domain-containing protein YaaA [Roseburia sp.]|nr:S4 domain-containing protein YaaA [Anaeroplasma bactoclasticum]MCM1195713.1 S4 domain-containing protein YaaA [Roseburia sp.]MCM1556063.1 S4 domain-containing protein YaaA [Anaeroplasma bactoclasticum]
MEDLKLESDYITLQQFLKIKNIISSGGEAKYYLASHKVYVNQELETRRGRKLYPKDIILVDGKEYQIK